MKAIIIDDEKRARSVLQILIAEDCPDVEVIAEASDIPEGIKLIREHRPDVVFLDIEMPEFSGFHLYDALEEAELIFPIIFTTAYSEYAIQAFEMSAVDYLLKPIQSERLIQAVERAAHHINANKALRQLAVLQTNIDSKFPKQLVIRTLQSTEFFNDTEIIYIQAEGAYSKFVTTSKVILASRNLSYFERMLNTHPSFFRTHRSYLINLDKVDRQFNARKNEIQMANGDILPLSRDKVKAFRMAMQTM